MNTSEPQFAPGMWIAMMAVMMLPGAVPAVIRIPGYRARLVFVAAYLVVWSVFGAAAAALQFMLESRHFLTSELALRSAAAANLSLLVIGAYQLTPLKRACLRLCRSEVVPLRYAFACLGASWQRPASASSSGEAPGSFCSLANRDADGLHRKVHLAQEVRQTDHESEHGDGKQGSDEPRERRTEQRFQEEDGDDHAHQQRCNGA